MTYDDWDRMRNWADNSGLPKNQKFSNWLWKGGPEGPGLKADLQFLAFSIWNLLFQEGNEREIGRQIAEKAVTKLKEPWLTEQIISRAQQIVRAFIDIVESKDPAFRHQTIDKAHSPEYIFRDAAREAAVQMSREKLPAILRRISLSPV